MLFGYYWHPGILFLSYRIISLLSSNAAKHGEHDYKTVNEDSEEDWKVFMKVKNYHVRRKKLNDNGKYLYKSKLESLLIFEEVSRKITS